MPCPKYTCAKPEDFTPILTRLKERGDPGGDVSAKVDAILARVADQGDAALVDYTRRFDCEHFTADMLPVDKKDLAGAKDLIPAKDMDILAEAAGNIRDFHEKQLQKSWWTTRPDGAILGQIVTPVAGAGLYVPGGRGGETPLISSMLMNAVPALTAGVERVAAVSPPRKDGSLNPYILAAADLLGIDEVYRSGSAWAMAAMAYGTETIAPVDVIAGPGNIFVTMAKAKLMSRVGVDMIAGPSEILVIADATADPAWTAADLLSQAEHDALAASILVTDSPETAETVAAELKKQTSALPRSEIAAKSLADYGALVTVPDLSTAAALANRIAPEHLELCVADPWALLPEIRHAGAVFLGHHCPEPVGDYFAGPNHVLPTMGAARFSSALSVETFLKKSSLISTSPAFIAKHGEKIARLARLEGLEAHARSVEIRLDTPEAS